MACASGSSAATAPTPVARCPSARTRVNSLNKARCLSRTRKALESRGALPSGLRLSYPRVVFLRFEAFVAGEDAIKNGCGRVTRFQHRL